jgi:hypothetical protein
MHKHFNLSLFVIFLISTLQACTTRVWYNSVQSAAQQSCRHQPPSEQARCEARLNKDDFDTYEKRRSQP